MIEHRATRVELLPFQVLNFPTFRSKDDRPWQLNKWESAKLNHAGWQQVKLLQTKQNSKIIQDSVILCVCQFYQAWMHITISISVWKHEYTIVDDDDDDYDDDHRWSIMQSWYWWWWWWWRWLWWNILTVTTIMTMMMVAPGPLASKRVDPSHQALDPLQTFLRHLVEGLFIIPFTRCNNNELHTFNHFMN